MMTGPAQRWSTGVEWNTAFEVEALGMHGRFLCDGGMAMGIGKNGLDILHREGTTAKPWAIATSVAWLARRIFSRKDYSVAAY